MNVQVGNWTYKSEIMETFKVPEKRTDQIFPLDPPACCSVVEQTAASHLHLCLLPLVHPSPPSIPHPPSLPTSSLAFPIRPCVPALLSHWAVSPPQAELGLPSYSLSSNQIDFRFWVALLLSLQYKCCFFWVVFMTNWYNIGRWQHNSRQGRLLLETWPCFFSVNM